MQGFFGRRSFGAAAIIGAGLASVPGSASANTDLVFCNNTGAKTFIALVYYETRTSKWMLSAWHARNPGECRSIGTYRTGIIYYFAEKEGRTASWPAKANVEKTFCVPATRIERVQLGGNCASGERLLGFRGINATGAKFTFNLNN